MVSKEVGCSEEEQLAVCALVGREQHRLEFEAEPGWSFESSLPEGWMKLPSEATYLSPDGFIFRTKDAMLWFVKKTKGEGAQKKIQNKIQKEQNPNKIRLWLEDPTIPNGWKSCSKGDGIHYKDQHGNTFRGRIEAIKYIQQKKGMDDGEHTIMMRGLEADGWKEKKHLPHGWRIKRYTRKETVKTEIKRKRRNDSTFYLTEKMELFKSLYDVIAQMKREGLTEEDISRLKEHTWTKDLELPQGWMYSFNLSGHKTYINSEGRYFGSLTQVARYMFIKHFPQEEFQMSLRALSTQGWEESDYLPQGWMIRKVSYQPGLYYLSNQFTMLSKKSEVEELLGALDSSSLELFKLNYGNIVGRPMREIKNEKEQLSVPISHINWEEDSSLPEGWMISPYLLMKGKYAGSQHFRCHTPSFQLLNPHITGFCTLPVGGCLATGARP